MSRIIKEVKIKIPNIDNFYNMLEKYNNLKVKEFDDYYRHIITKEEKHAFLIENSKMSDYERMLWGRSVSKYSIRDAYRFGSDRTLLDSDTFKRTTHSYKGSVIKNNVLYGTIELLELPITKPYETTNNLLLIPIFSNEWDINKRRILYMQIIEDKKQPIYHLAHEVDKSYCGRKLKNIKYTIDIDNVTCKNCLKIKNGKPKL